MWWYPWGRQPLEQVSILSMGTDYCANSARCYPLWPRSPWEHRGGLAPSPWGREGRHRLPAHQGWERRPRRTDEMWQACNKPLVTVTFARQPLAG